jgi:hypothetical protein
MTKNGHASGRQHLWTQGIERDSIAPNDIELDRAIRLSRGCRMQQPHSRALASNVRSIRDDEIDSEIAGPFLDDIPVYSFLRGRTGTGTSETVSAGSPSVGGQDPL